MIDRPQELKVNQEQLQVPMQVLRGIELEKRDAKGGRESKKQEIKGQEVS